MAMLDGPQGILKKSCNATQKNLRGAETQMRKTHNFLERLKEEKKTDTISRLESKARKL